MSTVVVFTSNNARILTVEDTSQYEKWPNAVINPDMSKVRNLPPHYWRLHKGQILPMDAISRVARDGELKGGAKNTIISKPIKSNIIKGLVKRFGVHILCFLTGATTPFMLQLIYTYITKGVL